MGATPSHEVDVAEDEPEDSEDDDILKMQNGRFRVSCFYLYFFFFFLVNNSGFLARIIM